MFAAELIVICLYPCFYNRIWFGDAMCLVGHTFMVLTPLWSVGRL